MTGERLYHISEQPGISRFEPRPTGAGEGRVWAINDVRLHNYLLPRNCPRVTFYVAPSTNPRDAQRFFAYNLAHSVVAIERCWLQRVLDARLYLYSFDAAHFELHDPIAGYHTSRIPVAPRAEIFIDDPLGALLARNVEFRVLESLAPLRRAVIESSLGFSIIRWRNSGESDS